MKSILLTVATLLGAFGAAGADVLVTGDGERVATNGPWEVRGRMVVFTLPDGTLASLRLHDVDLEASAAATEEAARPAPPAANVEQPAPEAVMVLTDDDVSRVGADALRDGSDDADGASGEAPAAAAPAGPMVTVSSWQEQTTGTGDGLTLIGVILNRGPHVAGNVRVTVTLIDVDGVESGSTTATLTTSTLPAGGQAQFRADFPSGTIYSTAQFDIAHLPIERSEERPTAVRPEGDDSGLDT